MSAFTGICIIETLEDDNAKEAIDNALKALVFWDENKMCIPENIVEKHKEKQYKRDVKEAHKAITFDVLDELSVPRNFINYTSFVQSNWVKYFNEAKKEHKKPHKRDDITIFLIFTLYYIQPEMVEPKYLEDRDQRFMDMKKDDELTLTFSRIRYGLFNYIFEERKDEEIIRRAIYALKKHPDLKSLIENQSYDDNSKE